MHPEALLMEEARGFVASVCNLRAQCGRFTHRIPGETECSERSSCLYLRCAVSITVVAVSKTNCVTIGKPVQKNEISNFRDIIQLKTFVDAI